MKTSCGPPREWALEIALPSARGSCCRVSHDCYPLGNQTRFAIVLEPLAPCSAISSCCLSGHSQSAHRTFPPRPSGRNVAGGCGAWADSDQRDRRQCEVVPEAAWISSATCVGPAKSGRVALARQAPARNPSGRRPRLRALLSVEADSRQRQRHSAANLRKALGFSRPWQAG